VVNGGRRASDDTDSARKAGQMHYIAVDLDTDAWVQVGFARLEEYLVRWRLFNDRHDDGSAWSEFDPESRKPD
jgi:hypothetical protein